MPRFQNCLEETCADIVICTNSFTKCSISTCLRVQSHLGQTRCHDDVKNSFFKLIIKGGRTLLAIFADVDAGDEVILQVLTRCGQTNTAKTAVTISLCVLRQMFTLAGDAHDTKLLGSGPTPERTEPAHEQTGDHKDVAWHLCKAKRKFPFRNLCSIFRK